MNKSKKSNSGSLAYLTAKLISRVFDPTWLIPLMLAAAVVWSVINGFRWRFLSVLLLIDGIIPFMYFVHLLRTKEISDWDTTKREERHQLYSFTVAVHATGVLLALFLGKVVLAKVLFAFWLLALAYTAITIRFKISLHAGVSAAGVTFLILLFGFKWGWGYLVVAIIGWARVVMGKHTFSQIIAGALTAPALLVSAWWALKIPL